MCKDEILEKLLSVTGLEVLGTGKTVNSSRFSSKKISSLGKRLHCRCYNYKQSLLQSICDCISPVSCRQQKRIENISFKNILLPDAFSGIIPLQAVLCSAEFGDQFLLIFLPLLCASISIFHLHLYDLSTCRGS